MEDLCEFSQLLSTLHPSINLNVFVADLEGFINKNVELCQTENCKEIHAGMKLVKQVLICNLKRALSVRKCEGDAEICGKVVPNITLFDEIVIMKILSLCEKVLSCLDVCEKVPAIIKCCYEVICVVFSQLSTEKQSNVIIQCLDQLDLHLQQSENIHISIFTTLLHSLYDILVQHSCKCETICARLVDILYKSLTVENDQITVTTVAYVLNLVLKQKLQTAKSIFEIGIDLWTEIKKIHVSYCQRHFKDYLENTSLTERPFTILVTSTTLFFAQNEFALLSHIFSDKTFWAILQHGLYHVNPLTRKRSLFLLKRVVDVMQQDIGTAILTHQLSDKVPVLWWRSNHEAEMLKIWNDIFLLLETLEEKQVHVIKPVMPKFHSLIEATLEQNGDPAMLHTSWILAIFQRIASHESSYVKRWGMSELLKINLSHCPVYQQGGHEFLTEPFIAMLTESTIYYKPVELNLGECPPVVQDLAHFLRATFQAVPQGKKGELLLDMLKGINTFCWSGAALLYVIRGMSFIETSQILSNNGMLIMKDIIVSITNSVESYFRGVIQQYLCSIVTCLINFSSVSVANLSSFLGRISGSECLQRGTVVWRQLSCWLFNSVTEAKGQGVEQWEENHVLKSIESLVQACLTAEIDHVEGSTGTVRLLLLAVDSGLLPLKSSSGSADQSKSLLSILSPVLDMLSSVGRRLYLAAEKADAVFLLFNSLCREAKLCDGQQDELFMFLRSVITPDLICSVLQYLTRRVSEVSVVDDIEKVCVLCETVSHISSVNGTDFQSTEVFSSLIQHCLVIVKETLETSQKRQVERCTGMVVLSSLCQTGAMVNTLNPLLTESFTPSMLCSDFKKPKELQSQQRNQKELGHIDWGRVSSMFLEAQWQCVHSVLCRDAQENMPAYGPQISVTMDLLEGVSLIPVFKCALLVMPKVSDEVKLNLLTMSWKRTEEQKKGSFFWSVYRAFLEILVKAASLATSETGVLNETLKEICDEIMSVGEEKAGMVNYFVSSLITWWEQSPSDMKHALDYFDILVRAAVFGEIQSKGKRFISEVYHYLQKCGDQLSVNQLLDHTDKDDSWVRVCTLTFLSKLRPDRPLHKQLALGLLKALFTNHKDLISQMGYRNFSNSLTHRKKHRILCAVMMLHLFFNEIQEEVFDYLMKGLLYENQPSVRHQIEWLLTRLLYQHTPFMAQFWSQFDMANEKKPSLLCSLLTVVTLLAKLQENDQKQIFLLEAIPKVFPFATVQQFNVRLFAQGFLLISWDMSLKQNLTKVLERHAILQSFLDFCQKNEQAKKATQKLLKMFVYSVHPFDDFTIENITSTLPYLCEVTDEEWIPVEKFECVANTWDIEGHHSLSLRGKSETLKAAKPGTWRVKSAGFDEDWMELTSDVQKKVIPWRLMLPEQELETGLQEEYMKKRQKTGGLVLVASLIDKIPNLGGLCRTSEIFGVSEYVLASFNHMRDKVFESLSVTSHKWLPIKEVKPHYLKTYLLEMREAGYTLVGAEQTANSVCLIDYTFPKKTVLLLGNEKEGIPVDIIQLLDVCVEIPQQGVVRSLNVHVSGALLVWEYTRQHLLTATEQ